MSTHGGTETTDPLHRLRDLALADLKPMALPSERTDIMMWAAGEIERLRAVLTRIAEGHGRCAICKTPCGTYTNTCDCRRPEWEPLDPSWEAAEALK